MKDFRRATINSSLLIKKYRKYMARGASSLIYPIVIHKARGCRVWDIDGNEYLDFISSAAVYNVGHTNEKIVGAVRSKMEEIIHYTGAYFITKPMIDLAEKLASLAPGSFNKKVIYGLSGSEAIDMAIKCVRSAKRRRAIISFFGSFHGTTCGATAVSGASYMMHRRVEPLLPNVYFAHFPDCFRCPLNLEYPSCNLACFNEVTTLLEYIVDPEDVAAVITEPIQGHAGIIIPPKEFFRKLSKLSREYDIPLIFDEIQTGIGRTGKMFACEHFNIAPDILVLGKALGGGFPISAVIGRASIMDSWETESEMPTLAGHTLSCIAALTTIDLIVSEGLCDKALRKGEYIVKRLKEFMEEYSIIGDVRGIGLMIGVDIVKSLESKEPDSKTAYKICLYSWKRGLLIMPIGKKGNVLRIQPPLVITQEEIDEGLDILEEVIKEVEHEKRTS